MTQGTDYSTFSGDLDHHLDPGIFKSMFFIIALMSNIRFVGHW